MTESPCKEIMQTQARAESLDEFMKTIGEPMDDPEITYKISSEDVQTVINHAATLARSSWDFSAACLMDVYFYPWLDHNDRRLLGGHEQLHRKIENEAMKEYMNLIDIFELGRRVLAPRSKDNGCCLLGELKCQVTLSDIILFNTVGEERFALLWDELSAMVVAKTEYEPPKALRPDSVAGKTLCSVIRAALFEVRQERMTEEEVWRLMLGADPSRAVLTPEDRQEHKSRLDSMTGEKAMQWCINSGDVLENELGEWFKEKLKIIRTGSVFWLR